MPAAHVRTLIVTPALNEEASVYNIVREVFDTLDDTVDCLVVDDGSTDRTAVEARRAGALVARLPFNLGVGGALRTGFQFALANQYTAVVQVDADGQHDPKFVPSLLAPLADHDIVVGARFAGEGDYQVHGPRRWAMKFLATCMHAITKQHLTDTTSGFKACGPRAIALFAEQMPAEYLGDTVEALVIAARAGCSITQVPVVMRARVAGRSSNGGLRSAKYLARVVMAMAVALLKPAATLRSR